MRRFLLTAVLAATAVVVFTTGVAVEDARAGAGLTAVGVRIENRPEAVRIVVRLSGAPLQEAQVFATSRPRKLTLGTARVRIVAPAAGAPLRSGPVSGVLVDVVPKPRELIVRATSSPGRFKYVTYRVRQNPQRLVIDLWKGAPPRPGARARFGHRGCLTIDVDSSQPGRLVVSGSVGQLFEGTFLVRIRRADGRAIKRRIVTMQPGQWQESIGYRVGRAQAGTVEALEES
jgi:hypothetical protein